MRRRFVEMGSGRDLAMGSYFSVSPVVGGMIRWGKVLYRVHSVWYDPLGGVEEIYLETVDSSGVYSPSCSECVGTFEGI